LTKVIKETAADGFNGDTMPFVPEDFYTQSVKIGHPIAMEPEGSGTADSANWDTMGWGYWYNDETRLQRPTAPGVDLQKWLDSRRLTNVCDRWAVNRTDNIQYAFFNGAGYEMVSAAHHKLLASDADVFRICHKWENIWGVWNQLTSYDCDAVRRTATILRYFGAGACPSLKAGQRCLLQSSLWEPHTPTVQQHVYASKFPSPARSDGSSDHVVWLMVNRAGSQLAGSQLKVTGLSAGYTFYDAYRGVKLTPGAGLVVNPSKDGNGLSDYTLGFDLEANGFGAVLATRAGTTAMQVQALPKLPRGSCRSTSGR
jgi:hypothetical protein